MNKHLPGRALLIIMALVASTCFAASPKKKQKQVAPTPIDIAATVDSALIMADDYATALQQNPKMAPTRLNQLRNFAKAKPTAVNDSICDRLYDFFVDYTESEDTPRAAAFKDCFLALASEDNPNLGPLYATQLAIARETTDTSTIKTYIPMLEDYARRLNYDYDEELASAREYLQTIRTRRPIDEELQGVWVSSEFMKFPLIATKYGFTVGKALNIMGGNSYSASAREAADEQKNAIMTLNIIAFGKSAIKGNNALAFGDKKTGYMALQQNECASYGITDTNDPRIKSKSNNRKEYWLANARETTTDNDSRWLYAMWHTENLNRNDPELSAALRQSIQGLQAEVAGQYSRSQYSFGDRLLANGLASGFSAITNSVIDYFSVSKDKIYTAELNLQLQNPNKLVGRLDIINVEVASNRQTPKVKERNAEVTYYRWTPEDNVFFLTTFDSYVPIFEPSKEESERMKTVAKRAKKYWEKNRVGDWFYLWFNGVMMQKLRRNAGENIYISPEIKELLDI